MNSYVGHKRKVRLLDLPDDILILILRHIIFSTITDMPNHCRFSKHCIPTWWNFAMTCAHLRGIVINFFQEYSLGNPRLFKLHSCSECQSIVSIHCFKQAQFSLPLQTSFTVPPLCNHLTFEFIKSVVKYCPQLTSVHFENGSNLDQDLISVLRRAQLQSLCVDYDISATLPSLLLWLPSTFQDIVLNRISQGEFTTEFIEILKTRRILFNNIEISFDDGEEDFNDDCNLFNHITLELYSRNKNVSDHQIYLKGEVNRITTAILELGGCDHLHVTSELKKLKHIQYLRCCSFCEHPYHDVFEIPVDVSDLSQSGSSSGYHHGNRADMFVMVYHPRFPGALNRILDLCLEEYDVLVRGDGMHPFTIFFPHQKAYRKIQDARLTRLSGRFLLLNSSPFSEFVDNFNPLEVVIDGAEVNTHGWFPLERNRYEVADRENSNSEEKDNTIKAMPSTFPSLKTVRLLNVTNDNSDSYYGAFSYICNILDKARHATVLHTSMEVLYALSVNHDLGTIFEFVTHLKEIHVFGHHVAHGIGVLDFLPHFSDMLKCIQERYPFLKVLVFHLEVDSDIFEKKLNNWNLPCGMFKGVTEALIELFEVNLGIEKFEVYLKPI